MGSLSTKLYALFLSCGTRVFTGKVVMEPSIGRFLQAMAISLGCGMLMLKVILKILDKLPNEKPEKPENPEDETKEK